MNYGKHVTRLHMDSISAPIWMLPCPNLKDLSLSECDVLFAPGDFGLQGVIPGCTKLTRLKFLGTIKDAADEDAAVELNILSRLVHLQHLELMPLIRTEGCTLSVPTLPRLGHLTHLNVHKLSAENLTQLGALTKLQELELSANITPVGPSTVPGLTFPASLTKLVLGSGTAVEAAVLSLLPVGLQHLAIECEVEGPGSFLAGMARLQCLTHLDLSSPQQIELGPVGPAYAALTASSKLAEFKLLAGLLPEDAWRYMFHEAGMLPNLTSLITWPSQTLPAPWGISDLWGVVRSCPNLCELPHVYLQHGDHVSYLQKLTGVTSVTLWYGGGYVEDVDESIEGLAAVTHLRELTVHLYSLSEITVDVLLPLTSLTALTDLNVVCFEADDPSDLDADGSDTGSEANLLFEVYVEQDESGPVWVQLLERCYAERSCPPKIVCSLAQQLAEQRALTEVHEYEIHEQQRQLAVQQRENVQQALQLQLQQDQLSAQQHAAAEQGSLVAELQGQLLTLQSQLQELLHRQQQ